MKEKRKQRILRLFLAAALVLTLLPLSKTTARAENPHGNCGKNGGNNVTWEYDDSSKTLTIKGNGDMADYMNSASRPWSSYKTSITQVKINGSVTSIGRYAFSECSSLTSFEIPNSVTNIGYQAFSYCSGLTSVKIPNSVTSIEGYAFYECTSLTSITIPNGVTSIGECTFYGCSGLTSFTIPNSVTSIGYCAFCECTGLTSVTIPNSVTSIGDSAFFSCRKLESVNIPNSVTSIGESAFQYCANLTSITIPNSVTSIGGYAFRDCTSLTSITIPNSVTSIGDRTFRSCTNLTSVSIPPSVTSIADSAFEYCDASLTIYGAANSKAQEYASENHIDFGTVTFVPVPSPKNFYYDGTEHTGVSTDTQYRVLSASNTKGTDAGTYTVYVSLIDSTNCRWSDWTNTDKTLTWKIEPASISSTTITLPNQTYTYNGSAFTPEPTVKIGNSTLTKDKDYSVSYSNHTNAGTATVTITGKGSCTGTKTATFTIAPADLSSATVTLPDQTYTYNGSAFTPEPTVKIGNDTLVKDKDYSVSYSNNTNAGTATVTITGKGNYTGTKETTFVINPAPNSDAKEPDTKDSTTKDDSTKQGTENTTETVAPTKPGASVEDTEKFITGLTNDNDPAGSDYQTLQAKAIKVTKSSVKLSWKRVAGAKGYIIYGNKCGKKNKYKKIKTVTNTSYTQKKLKKGTYYKYLIVAYDKDNKVLTTSKTIHAATTGGKYDNAKSVTTKAKKDKVTVKVNKTFNLKAKAVAGSKKGKMEKHRAIQYESTDTNIATVSAKGVITGKAKGTCYVYVYAMNGVSKKIKVTVK